MPLELDSDAIVEKNKLTSTNVEILLIEVNYEDEDTIRICLNNEEVVWPAVTGETWYPAIFSLTGLSETKDAEIPKVTLSFYDLENTIIPLLEEFSGCSGAEVIIRIVHSNYLPNTTPHLEETMELIDSSVNDSLLVNINLGAENLSNLRIPKQRYLKNNCRFKFKVATVAFISGDSPEPVVGNVLFGLLTGAKATILKIDHTSGTWAGGDAAGTFTILYGPTTVEFNDPENVSSYDDLSLTTELNNNVATFNETPSGRCGYVGSEIDCNRSFARCQELLNHTRFGGFPGVGSGGLLK